MTVGLVEPSSQFLGILRLSVEKKMKPWRITNPSIYSEDHAGVIYVRPILLCMSLKACLHDTWFPIIRIEHHLNTCSSLPFYLIKKKIMQHCFRKHPFFQSLIQLNLDLADHFTSSLRRFWHKPAAAEELGCWVSNAITLFSRGFSPVTLAFPAGSVVGVSQQAILSNTDRHLQPVFIWRSGPTQWLRLTLNSHILRIQLPQKLGFQATGPMLYLTGSGLHTNGTHDCYGLNYICVCAHAHTPVSVLAHLCATVRV